MKAVGIGKIGYHQSEFIYLNSFKFLARAGFLSVLPPLPDGAPAERRWRDKSEATDELNGKEVIRIRVDE